MVYATGKWTRLIASKVKIKSAYWAVRMFGRWAINSSEPRKGI